MFVYKSKRNTNRFNGGTIENYLVTHKVNLKPYKKM